MPDASERAAPSGPDTDDHAPGRIARIWIEAKTVQLDRSFDYLVPETLSDQAVVGAKVRVPFSGRLINGWILERTRTTETDAALKEIKSVLSPHPIMSPEYFALMEQVARRQAAMVSDTMRLAVPPRVAAVDAALADEAAKGLGEPFPDAWLRWGQALLSAGSGEGSGPEAASEWEQWHQALADGGGPRGILLAPRLNFSAPAHALLAAIGACVFSGRQAIVVVPDHRRLEQLQESLRLVWDQLEAEEQLPPWQRLEADDAPTARYRAYLRTLRGEAAVVIGTRAAAYAPVADPGLFLLWDDADTSLIEQRSPYCHPRDVLLIRAQRSGAAMLIAGNSLSLAAVRLAEIGWGALMRQQSSPAQRPRTRVTGSDYELERDPLAQRARIPSAAFETARRALAAGTGPVLMQVARAGFSPVIRCTSCSAMAHCAWCNGPLEARAKGAPLHCRWCTRVQDGFTCHICGGGTVYQPVAGALRTAEEIARAFPGTEIVISQGEHQRAEIDARSCLVIATAGSEPWVRGGEYAAAILLDADTHMARPGLYATEQALRRWFHLMAQVSSRGEVVATVSDQAAMNALVGSDPYPMLVRVYEDHRATFLPPTVRVFALMGQEDALMDFVARVRKEAEQTLKASSGRGLSSPIREAGPVPLEPEDWPEGSGPVSRSYLFFSYADAPAVARAVASARALQAVAKTRQSVRVWADPTELLL